jgi:phospholipase D1/2
MSTGDARDAFRFAEGDNCWRLAQAESVACLVDGEAYFRAFKRAALEARESILIIGWDVNSRVALEYPDKAMPGVPNRLGAFLTHLLRRRKDLRIHVLNWDSPLLYKIDREWLPRLRIDWLNHRRAFYALDNQHPVGGAQHQKIVVIDDALAFVGGIDFSAGRLDSRAHAPGDEGRRLPGGGDIPQPHHDIQMAVSGEAARHIGEIARERWEVATGEAIAAPSRSGDPEALWPQGLEPDFTDHEVAIARTRAAWKSITEMRQIEALYRTSIAAARDWIYIENQYVTARAVGAALAERLREPGGPEIVMLLPREPTRWIEQTAMGINQRRILTLLREADHEGRLHVYIPMNGEAGDEPIMVHAKTMVIDGRFLRIGSSNLNNRSMGLDSECDIALTAEAGSADAQRIVAYRDDLLAEHLACDAHDVARAIAEEGTIAGAIARLRPQRGRTLVDYPHRPPHELDTMIADTGILDPSGTPEPERLADSLTADAFARGQLRSALLGLAATLVALVAFAVFWQTAPGEMLDEAGELNAAGLAASWWGGVALMLATYLVAGFVMFPLLILILATGLIYGPLVGLAIAAVGSLASACLGYAGGALIGRKRLRRLTRGRLEHVGQALMRNGILSVLLIRLIPVAPYGLVNMVAGARRIAFSRYLAGTALGLAPGAIAITLFSSQLRTLLVDPGVADVAVFALVLAGIVGIGSFLWRRFAERITRRRR